VGLDGTGGIVKAWRAGAAGGVLSAARTGLSLEVITGVAGLAVFARVARLRAVRASTTGAA
jgi:hypothetical protein